MQQNISEITCDLNIKELKKFNVKYLFSTVRIQNAEEIGLEEITINESLEYYYRLFIYQI